jgi:pilus assembly protein CpaD
MMNLGKLSSARFALTLAMVLTLGACANLFKPASRSADPQYLATGKHRIVVTQGERSLPINFGEGEAKLAPHKLAPVQAFVDEFVDDGGGTMYLEVGGGQSEEQIAGKLAYLGTVFRKRGVRSQEMVVRPATDSVADVTLVVAHYEASVPGCPDWSSPIRDLHKNTTHSNFGCATRSNFARMLANPRDMIEPRKMGNGEGFQASRAIGGYRSGNLEEVKASSSEIGDDE